MWVLKYYNTAMDKWYKMDAFNTMEDAKAMLQQWIDDEYYSSNITSFAEEDYPDENLYIFIIDGEIFGIWMEEEK
jgi:hypothetical protein